jgi:hypothetical protein
MFRFLGGVVSGIKSAACKCWRTVSGLAGKKNQRRSNCEMRLMPKVGFCCLSSRILSEIGTGNLGARSED